MTALSHPVTSVLRARRATDARMPAVHRLRRSRSIASMLAALLLSGVITLAMTAVMHLIWNGWSRGVGGIWMESWLTAWPIAFPLTYLLGSAVVKAAAYISAPTARMQAQRNGLAFGDIAQVSDSVTAQNNLVVLRNLKPAHDFRAV